MSVQDHETGPPSSRWTPWRPMIRAMLAIGLIGGALPAFGQSTTVFDKPESCSNRRAPRAATRELARRSKAGRQLLEAGHNEVLTFQCPDEAPYFAGWDTEQQ